MVLLADNTRVSRAALALLCMQRHSWEQGVAMQAFYEMGQSDIVISLAREAVNRSLPDGRLATIGVIDAVTDSCATGEALLAACTMTGDSGLRNGYDALLHWALEDAPRSRKGVVYHLINTHEFWVDSMYMLPPYLASAGKYEEALINIFGYWEALYDPDARLMFHKWDEDTHTYIHPVHWGSGNGWAIAGIARVIGLLPESYQKEKQRLGSMGKTLVDSVLLHMRPDGLFHDVIDDKNTFVETNVTQMLAYSIFRGMMDGWLDKGYIPIVNTLRLAAQNKIDCFGFVQDVCGAPTFDKSGISPEAQSFYLMMETAAAQFEQRQF